MIPPARGTVVWLLCVAGLFLSFPVPATAQNDLLIGRTAADAAYLAMQTIPRLVYDGQPDSLLDWLDAWSDQADFPEPAVRLRILGAIWDGQFNEDLYGPEIIDQLVSYGTGSPLDGDEPPLSADLAAEVAVGAAPPCRIVRQDFETFSAAFADQLLPHVPPASPEEFFCLMYSGRRDQAWRLLASDDLEETWLRSYRDRKVAELRKALPMFVAAQGGWWSPFDKYAFADEHPLTGVQVGVRRGPWFARVVGEMRLGRTRRGYLVRKNDILGVSDRFNAVLFGMELGRARPLWGPLSLEAFGGVGWDAVKPLKDEDVILEALHLDVGAGMHLDLGAHRHWFLALTGRREWISQRNTEGTPLGGDAWSVRLAVGVNLNVRSGETLALLQPSR